MSHRPWIVSVIAVGGMMAGIASAQEQPLRRAVTLKQPPGIELREQAPARQQSESAPSTQGSKAVVVENPPSVEQPSDGRKEGRPVLSYPPGYLPGPALPSVPAVPGQPTGEPCRKTPERPGCQCPVGTTRQGEICVQVNPCPQGYRMGYSGRCEDPCPRGYKLGAGGRCVSSVVCNPPKVLQPGGFCKEPPSNAGVWVPRP